MSVRNFLPRIHGKDAADVEASGVGGPYESAEERCYWGPAKFVVAQPLQDACHGDWGVAVLGMHMNRMGWVGVPFGLRDQLPFVPCLAGGCA